MENFQLNARGSVRKVCSGNVLDDLHSAAIRTVLLLPRYFSTQFTLKQKHLSCRVAIFFWFLLIPVRSPCYQPSCHRYVSPVISHHITSPCPLLSAIMSPVRILYQPSCHQSMSPVISHETSPFLLLSATSAVRVSSYQPCHQSVSPVISHVTSSCPPVISHVTTVPLHHNLSICDPMSLLQTRNLEIALRRITRHSQCMLFYVRNYMPRKRTF
jgi:hypothetical protein